MEGLCYLHLTRGLFSYACCLTGMRVQALVHTHTHIHTHTGKYVHTHAHIGTYTYYVPDAWPVSLHVLSY